MQKYHSFLKRIEDNLNNMFSVKIGKYKKATASVAYVLATVLVVLTPNSIYGASNSIVARAQVIPGISIEEETDHAVIMQTNEDIIELVTQEVEETNQDAEEAVEIQADDKSSNVAILVSEGSTIEKKITEEYEKLLINKEAAKKVTEYINVSEAEELAAIAAREEAALQAIAEQRAAKEAEEQAAIEAAQKAAAEQAAAKKEAAAKAASSNKVGSYSKNDIAILERIVEAEATGEDTKGKIMVANVIINRVNNKRFPNSIEGVVFQKGQFSPIRDGRYNTVKISNSTKEAVSRALQGEDYSKGALYFAARQKASSKNMKWFDSKLTYLYQHGGHQFFK